MRALERPKPEHNFNATTEINNLINHRDKINDDPKKNRHIPAVDQAGKILIATWNIANLGVHKRRLSDIKVIAEILSWFEIVAIQEVADNLKDFNLLIDQLPDHFDWIFNDRAGNDERSAYIYDTRRVILGPKIGEVVIVESDRKHIKLDGIDREFDGFNRNPYLASFIIEDTQILLANCHLIYGPSNSAKEKKILWNVDNWRHTQLQDGAIFAVKTNIAGQKIFSLWEISIYPRQKKAIQYLMR